MRKPNLIKLNTLFFLGSLLVFSNLNAQQVKVISNGNLNFGTFSKINGGTITIDHDGFATTNKTGDIFLVSSIRSSATIALSTKANNGVQVSVTGPDSNNPINLTGTGGSLQLYVSFDRTTFTLIQNKTEYIEMGGTLIVGSGAGSGTYFLADVPVTFSYQ